MTKRSEDSGYVLISCKLSDRRHARAKFEERHTVHQMADAKYTQETDTKRLLNAQRRLHTNVEGAPNRRSVSQTVSSWAGLGRPHAQLSLDIEQRCAKSVIHAKAIRRSSALRLCSLAMHNDKPQEHAIIEGQGERSRPLPVGRISLSELEENVNS